MKTFPAAGFDELLVQAWARRHVGFVSKRLEGIACERTAAVAVRLAKVLEAFSSERVATQHFAS
ncbi:MAG: aluminum resistance family protein, partial [Cyanobacteriota bacterium]|nr:aluminum resistance family protein [Cyanobacteriota bacterium]